MTLLQKFMDTRRKSDSVYGEYTEKMKASTHIYTEAELTQLTFSNVQVNVYSVQSDSIRYILNDPSWNKKRAVLNFADGYTPGGMVAYSDVKTQEECLCRTSNLYESLILPACSEKYYEYNTNTPEYNTGRSSDRIIYSPDVLFFKDADLEECPMISPKNICDVITCPAPIVIEATDDIVLRRMSGIIRSAADHGVQELILGAWGCGVFGNDIDHFLSLWKKAIRKNRYVPMITFAFLHMPRKPLNTIIRSGWIF